MTDQGPTWARQVPRHWNTLPLFACGREVKVKNRGLVEENLLSLSYGQIIRKDINGTEGLLPASFETYQIVEPNDVIFRFTDLQNDKRSLRTGLVGERGIITSAYMNFRPTQIYAPYFAYLMRSYDLSKVFYGFGGGIRQSLSFEDVRRLPILVPPPAVQRAIADFLDRETAKIDALIEKQVDLAMLLKERRATKVSYTVAQIIGIGERMKWRFTEVDDRAGTRAADLPLLSVSIAWGVRLRDEVEINQSAGDDLAKYKIARRGDIVINRMRAFQGALGVAPADGLVSPDYAVLRIQPDADPAWLALVMRSQPFVAEMTSRLRGIGTVDGSNVRTPRVAVSDIGEIRIQIPSIEDQQAAVANYSSFGAKIDTLIAKAEEHVALAKERRAALITAAVTGQIDVTGKAA